MRGKTIGLLLGKFSAKGHLWESLALQAVREHVWGKRVKERNKFIGTSKVAEDSGVKQIFFFPTEFISCTSQYVP